MVWNALPEMLGFEWDRMPLHSGGVGGFRATQFFEIPPKFFRDIVTMCARYGLAKTAASREINRSDEQFWEPGRPEGDAERALVE